MSNENTLIREEQAQAMKNPRPTSFGEKYGVFAARESIAFYLERARLRRDRIESEILWLEELDELRAEQMEEGVWP